MSIDFLSRSSKDPMPAGVHTPKVVGLVPCWESPQRTTHAEVPSAMTAPRSDARARIRSAVSPTWDPSLESMTDNSTDSPVKRYRQRQGASTTVTTTAPKSAPVHKSKLTSGHPSSFQSLRSRIPAPPLSPGRKRGRLTNADEGSLAPSSVGKVDVSKEETAPSGENVAPSSPTRLGTIKERLKYFDRSLSEKTLMRTPFVSTAKLKAKLPFVQLDDGSDHSVLSFNRKSNRSSRALNDRDNQSSSGHHSNRDTDQEADNRSTPPLTASPNSSSPRLRMLAGFRGPSSQTVSEEAAPLDGAAKSSPVARGSTRLITLPENDDASNRSRRSLHKTDDASNRSWRSVTKRFGNDEARSEGQSPGANLKSRGRVPRPTSPLRASSPLRRPVQLTLSGCVANLDSLSKSSHHRRGLHKSPNSWLSNGTTLQKTTEEGPYHIGSLTPPSTRTQSIGSSVLRAPVTAKAVKSKISDLILDLGSSSRGSPPDPVGSRTPLSTRKQSVGTSAPRAPKTAKPTKSKISDLIIDMNSSSSSSPPEPVGSLTAPLTPKKPIVSSALRASATARPTKPKLSDLSLDISSSSRSSTRTDRVKTVQPDITTSSKPVARAVRSREPLHGQVSKMEAATPSQRFKERASNRIPRGAPFSAVPTKSKLSDLIHDASISSHTSSASQKIHNHYQMERQGVVRAGNLARQHPVTKVASSEELLSRSASHRTMPDEQCKSHHNSMDRVKSSWNPKLRPEIGGHADDMADARSATSVDAKSTFAGIKESKARPSPWGVKLRSSTRPRRAASPVPSSPFPLIPAPPLSLNDGHSDAQQPGPSKEIRTTVAVPETKLPVTPRQFRRGSKENSGDEKGSPKTNASPLKIPGNKSEDGDESIDIVRHPTRSRAARKARPTSQAEMTRSASVKAFASSFVFGSSVACEGQNQGTTVSNLFIAVSTPPSSPSKVASSSPVRVGRQRESIDAHAKKGSEIGFKRTRSKSIGSRTCPVKIESSPLPTVQRKHLKEALTSDNEGSVRDRLKLFEALENVNKELTKARAQVSAQRRLTYAERQQQRLKAAKKVQALVRGVLHRQSHRRNVASTKIQRLARRTLLRTAYRRRKAAILIQSYARSIRPRLQYRLRKLQESEEMINQRKRNDLMLIQLRKWKMMEGIRKEVESRMEADETSGVEHEQRQAEVAQLKRENAAFVEEQQKLTEMHLHFTMMRMMTEQAMQMHSKNYETVQEAVVALTEKNDALTSKQIKLEERIEVRTNELELLNLRIQYETAVRACSERGVQAIIGAIESRCQDKRLVKRVLAISRDEEIDESLGDASLSGISRGDKSARISECGFELSFRIRPLEDDDISMLEVESTVSPLSMSRGHRHRSDSKSCHDLDVTDEGDEEEVFEEEIVEYELVEEEVIEEEVVEDDGDGSYGDFSCESSVYMERSIIM